VPHPTFIRAHANGIFLAVKLQPRATANEICKPLGNELKIKVTAPPVDAAANQALVDLLAEKLNCSRGKIQIVRGQTSRHKTVWIEGKTVEAILESLQFLHSSGDTDCK
jgi:uncharacterized protein (TIGR00251 family)